ncbi:MAG: hypothetical protein FWF70_01200 [Bacteroidetes bacterium]|nr:hypothetical protein [Bacteroidota bacterium]MCL1969409.1 hypothetical protein [Bacteroidota bacterium]
MKYQTKYRFLLAACCLLLSSLTCSAQSDIPPPQSMQKESPLQKKRPTFTVGGSFGFQFGSYNSINVMPQGGVYATNWLVVLATGQYSYMWNRVYFNSHVWGVGAALEPIIKKKIIIHTGYEFEQIKFKWLDGSPQQIENFHFLVVGGGYKQYMSQRVYFQALILFNIPLTQPSIQNYYNNYYPYFRIGIGVDI